MENSEEARFCNQCGSPLAAEETKSSKEKKSIDSYILIGGAFIVSIIILLLIFSSNADNLNAKVQGGQAASQKSPDMNSGQPSMEMMQQIQSLKNAWKEDPKGFDSNIQLANAYFDISKFDKAVVYYNNANLAKPAQPNILIDLGISYFNTNETDSALFYIEEALKIQPEHMYGLYNAGIIYYNLNNVDAALSVWEKLIASHSGTREAQAAQEFINQIKSQ